MIGTSSFFFFLLLEGLLGILLLKDFGHNLFLGGGGKGGYLGFFFLGVSIVF